MAFLNEAGDVAPGGKEAGDTERINTMKNCEET